MKRMTMVALATLMLTACGTQENLQSNTLDAGTHTEAPKRVAITGSMAVSPVVVIDTDSSYISSANWQTNGEVNDANPLENAQYVDPKAEYVIGQVGSETDKVDYYWVSGVSRVSVKMGGSKAGVLAVLDEGAGAFSRFSISPSGETSLPLPAQNGAIVVVSAPAGEADYVLSLGGKGSVKASFDSLSGYSTKSFLATRAGESNDYGRSVVEVVPVGAVGKANDADSLLGMVRTQDRDKWAAGMAAVYAKAVYGYSAVEPDIEVVGLGFSGGDQWSLERIGLDHGLAYVPVDGDFSVVAVIDTGVFASHPGLAGRLVPGYDVIENGDDGDGYDADPETPLGGSFHGTHVAGIIAGVGFDGAPGYRGGVGQRVKVMPVRALNGHMSGLLSDVLTGVLYAAGLPNPTGALPERAADVINMSLGAPVYSEIFASVMRDVAAKGIAVVASAGNSGGDALMYPASYEGVVSVGAVNQDGALASYSQRNAAVDLLAPGGDVEGVLSLSATVLDGQLQYGVARRSGTSMAAPFVSGVLGEMIQVAKDNGVALLPGMIERMIEDGYFTGGGTQRSDERGYGELDYGYLMATFAGDLGQGYQRALLDLPQKRIDFGYLANEKTLEIVNAGVGSLDYDITVPVGCEWVSLAQIDTFHWSVTADREALPDGFSACSLLVTSNGGEGNVRIEVNKLTREVGGFGGAFDVALVQNGVMIAQKLIDERDDYRFSFEQNDSQTSFDKTEIWVRLHREAAFSACKSELQCVAKAVKHETASSLHFDISGMI